jgi:hypothetical protein
MKVNFASLKDVQHVTVVMPKINDRYRWYNGHSEITEKRFLFWTKVIREEVEPGWTTSRKEFPGWTDSTEYVESSNTFVRDGNVWFKGSVTIRYRNSENYVFKSESEGEINVYLKRLRGILGEDFIEFIKS